MVLPAVSSNDTFSSLPVISSCARAPPAGSSRAPAPAPSASSHIVALMITSHWLCVVGATLPWPSRPRHGGGEPECGCGYNCATPCPYTRAGCFLLSGSGRRRRACMRPAVRPWQRPEALHQARDDCLGLGKVLQAGFSLPAMKPNHAHQFIGFREPVSRTHARDLANCLR